MDIHRQKALNNIVPQTLYVVATPIGNLSDITLRALAVLERADLICAEDTRVSQQLLAAYGLSKRLISVREQNEQQMAEKIIATLAEGKVVAQISDAGTPAVCDPGARLVKRVRESGYSVIPVVGASAVMATLSVAGVVQSDFYFTGFLPAKKGEKKTLLNTWVDVPYPVVMFETPHRIEDTLVQMSQIFPERHLFVAREVSKTYETYLAGSVVEVMDLVMLNHHYRKGEMVLVLHPALKIKKIDGLSDEALRVMGILMQDLPTKTAAKMASAICGENKKALYDWAIEGKNR